MLPKVTPDSKRVDSRSSQLRILDLFRGTSCERQSDTYPFRRLAVRIQWATALASTVSCKECFANAREIIHIFRQRFSGRTRRAAEYSCCAHTEKEDAVIRSIFPKICALHFFYRWHGVHVCHSLSNLKNDSTDFLTVIFIEKYRVNVRIADCIP